MDVRYFRMYMEDLGTQCRLINEFRHFLAKPEYPLSEYHRDYTVDAALLMCQARTLLDKFQSDPEEQAIGLHIYRQHRGTNPCHSRKR